MIWPLIRFLIELRLYQLHCRDRAHRRLVQEIVRQVYYDAVAPSADS